MLFRSVVPAIDAPLNTPRTWCTRRVTEPDSVPQEEWTDVRLTDWEELTDDLGEGRVIPNSTVGWVVAGAAVPDGCSAFTGGPAPPFPTVRIGLSLAAWPRPFVSLGVRVDVEPLLWADAAGVYSDFPELGIHPEAWQRIEPTRPMAVNVLVDIHARASISF